MTDLATIYKQAAAAAKADGCTPDDSPNGCVSQWVQRNVAYREGTLFFIVLGITAELADLEAQEQGYENAVDRALKRAIQTRLEYLRGELRAERISYEELHELQSYAEHIDAEDVELRQVAGIPEFDD